MSSVPPFPLRGLVDLVLGGRPWLVREEDAWCRVSPPDHPSRVQGWKLHVSATPVSAPVVLQRAAEVLVEHGCAFKFARTLHHVAELTGKTTDRAQVGKFLTAYPRDDDHLRRLAPLLDAATAGLPGPVILSDRPYRDGSLVHYRYGAFTGVPVLTNDGSFEVRLRAPDGTLVDDVRQPWFCPPPWAELPFPGPPGRAAQPPATPQPVLLADRFEVRSTIVSSARGGVHRAVDRQTGERVVVKRARPHVSGLVWQGDARDGLRREAELLRRLDGLAAQPVAVVEQDRNVFLILSEVPGRPVTAWVQERLATHPAGRDEGPAVGEVSALALRLADLVDRVHARGLVYRDLTPHNVMVTDDGELRLIDAELAAAPGEWVATASTPGFGAPEAPPGRVAPAPDYRADHFSLGVLLCYLATGCLPPPQADSPPARPARERMAVLLRYAGARNAAATLLTPAILGLTDPDPATRWTTAELRKSLAVAGASAGSATTAAAPTSPRTARLEPHRQRRLLADGIDHLVAGLDTASPDRLFPAHESGRRSDPLNVQFGAAGLLAVLTRAYAVTGTDELRGAVGAVAGWVDARLMNVPRLLPGLYFGRTGTAWALYDAARSLEDHALAERALTLLRATPTAWPNPDVCHGTAGAGFANLHLWHRTGLAELRDRVASCVDALLAAARTHDDLVCWPVPADFDSRLAGIRHLGFAHGVAGVGAFLLAAGVALGRDDAVAAARRAGETLAATAVRADGAAWWPNQVTGPASEDIRYHWCSGASGVGTFLIRLWRATGEATYLDLAREAAVTVRHARWRLGIPACHGLVGEGEFLLDLAEFHGGPYRAWAEELAACLYARHSVRDGRLVVTESSNAGNLAYNTGMAGVVGFLLRLRHGGRRWWMADDAWDGPHGPTAG